MSHDWKETLISTTTSTKDVIGVIDKEALRIALVVDDNHHLLGTVTDGDIRRGFLNGLRLQDPIDSVFCKSPIVVPPALSRDAVLQFMNANSIYQLPVVDADGTLVGLHSIDEIISPSKRENTMVIMAGGKGTRLRPFTKNCPKPLLEVSGKPMLQHIIERASDNGFNNFVLSVHYLGHMIEEYFGDGSRFNVKIDYLHEESPLGTAGALALLEKPNKPLVITNGDVLTDINYGEVLDFHASQKAVATMAVNLHEWQHPFGVVRTKGIEIIGFEEKPIYQSHINAGVYVLDPDVLDLLTPNENCDMPVIFNRLQEQKKRTIVYPMHEPWIDVGQPKEYKNVNNRI